MLDTLATLTDPMARAAFQKQHRAALYAESSALARQGNPASAPLPARATAPPAATTPSRRTIDKLASLLGIDAQGSDAAAWSSVQLRAHQLGLVLPGYTTPATIAAQAQWTQTGFMKSSNAFLMQFVRRAIAGDK